MALPRTPTTCWPPTISFVPETIPISQAPCRYMANVPVERINAVRPSFGGMKRHPPLLKQVRLFGCPAHAPVGDVAIT